MCVYIYIWSKPEEILSCSHENCPTCMRVHYLRTTEHVHESTQTRVRHSFIVSKSSVHCLNKILSLSIIFSICSFSFSFDRPQLSNKLTMSSKFSFFYFYFRHIWVNSLSLYSSSIFLFQCLLIPSSIVSVFPFSFLPFGLLVLWTWGHTMIMMANWNSQQPVSNVCMHGSCQTCQFFWPLISSNKSNHFRNRTKEKYVCVNEWNIDVILLDLLPTKK
jgi:hypothetical protein